MLYYMNCDTGNVIRREIGDEPVGDLWLEISEDEFYEHCPWMKPATYTLDDVSLMGDAEKDRLYNSGAKRIDDEPPF